MEFKRNQVEEALAGAFGDSEPMPNLRSKVKRLLDLDRSWGRNQRADDAIKANYAFFIADPPGKGAEVWFSGYDVLAIFLGVQMLRHGWPQAHVVQIMRQFRPRLESLYPRIVSESRADMLKPKAPPKAGELAHPMSNPLLLAISAWKKDEQNPVDAEICRGMKEYFEFWKRVGRPGTTQTIIEISGAAVQLADLLTRTEPRSRGRSS